MWFICIGSNSEIICTVVLRNRHVVIAIVPLPHLFTTGHAVLNGVQRGE